MNVQEKTATVIHIPMAMQLLFNFILFKFGYMKKNAVFNFVSISILRKQKGLARDMYFGIFQIFANI